MSSEIENENKEKEEEKEIENNTNENNDNNELLNKKTNRDLDSLDEEDIPENKNKQKKLEGETEEKKIVEYEYGYIIQFLENGEGGLMEDFLPKISNSSDYFNYGLTKEEFDKMVHDSLLFHYENHLKEEKEKRDKMNMFMFNMNNMNINMNMNNMGNNFIQRGIPPQMAQMNNFFMNNFNYNNANNNENNNNNINRINTDNKQ